MINMTLKKDYMVPPSEVSERLTEMFKEGTREDLKDTSVYNN